MAHFPLISDASRSTKEPPEKFKCQKSANVSFIFLPFMGGTNGSKVYILFIFGGYQNTGDDDNASEFFFADFQTQRRIDCLFVS